MGYASLDASAGSSADVDRDDLDPRSPMDLMDRLRVKAFNASRRLDSPGGRASPPLNWTGTRVANTYLRVFLRHAQPEGIIAAIEQRRTELDRKY